MKVVIDVNDNKAGMFLDMIKRLDYVKGVDEVLPENKVSKHPTNSLAPKSKKAGTTETDLLKAFVLAGPVMDTDQINEYKNFRKRFNSWRQK